MSNLVILALTYDLMNLNAFWVWIVFWDGPNGYKLWHTWYTGTVD